MTRTWAALIGVCLVIAGAACAPGRSASPSHQQAPAPPFNESAESWRIPLTELVIPLHRVVISVPILEYHYVRIDTNRNDRLGFNLSVTPTDFAAQMAWLDTHGYHPVTFDDLREYFSGTRALPSRPVVLTFDDGYEDFFATAEPILRRHNFRAVAYVVPGFWGREAYMEPGQIVQLDRSGLVEIASHTMDHVDLAVESPAERAYELEMSRKALQRLLGHPVTDFCYPSGEFRNGAIAAVAAAGYSTATTELPGTELAWSTRLIWPRVRVSGGEMLKAFIVSLGRPEPFVSEKLF